jgi:hypothetical protein
MEPSRQRGLSDTESLSNLLLRHVDKFDRSPNLLGSQQVQMRAQSIIHLTVDFFREDFLAASLANREFEIRNGESVQTPVVPDFRLVVGRRHDDFLFAAVTASPWKWPFGQNRTLLPF